MHSFFCFRLVQVPQLFAGGQFIGGCSDALVLHSLGKLEPMLRTAAGEALEGGEAALPPPSGVRANAPAAAGGGKKDYCPHGHGKAESPKSGLGDEGRRPSFSRSLSA